MHLLTFLFILLVLSGFLEMLDYYLLLIIHIGKSELLFISFFGFLELENG